MYEEQEESGSFEPGLMAKALARCQTLARRIWPVAAIFMASLLAIFISDRLSPRPVPRTNQEIDEIVGEVMASATPETAHSVLVYQTILPSLVLIQIQTEEDGDQERVGIGSGVIINESGEILTALHVVEKAVEIEVFFADGTNSIAELISAEPDRDIAVLQPAQLPEVVVPAILGSSTRLRVGDETFAVGNPLGLAGSLSAGVISGFDRSLPADEEGQRLDGLIQFDAAVNPGNSGGPLLNEFGRVIGVVTALANASDQSSFTGIGFAVPIESAAGAAGAPPR